MGRAEPSLTKSTYLVGFVFIQVTYWSELGIHFQLVTLEWLFLNCALFLISKMEIIFPIFPNYREKGGSKYIIEKPLLI